MELKNKLINLLNKHFSLLILGAASLSFFLTNIILKDYLSSENYGLYSIFITYISLLSSFGLLGFEQVIIRTASIFSDKIIISNKLLVPIIISALLVAVLGSFLFINNYNLLVSHTFLFFISLLVVITKLFFNLFRLLSEFTFSQFALNFWKFGLFIVLLILIFSRKIIILEDIIMIIFIFLIMSMFMVFALYNKVQFSPILSSNTVLRQAGLFLLSLVTISLINFGDRFFIESRFGLQDLGDYFFFINLFLFPFTLFQSYVGFKEIVNFKLSYNQDLLAEKLKKIFKYSLIFGVFLFILSFLIDYFDVYHIKLIENSSMIILLIVLGIVKMVYSLLSSAMGAICNNQMLFKINLYSIISILILCPFIYYYSTTITITILFLIVLWLIRCVIWYKQLLSFEN